MPHIGLRVTGDAGRIKKSSSHTLLGDYRHLHFVDTPRDAAYDQGS